MGHPVTIDWERPAPQGGWHLLARHAAVLEPQSRAAMPPHGGHKVKVHAALGMTLTTSHRALVNGKTYPVVEVGKPDGGFVVVTLAVPDRASQVKAASTPTRSPGVPYRVRLLDLDGVVRADGWADVSGDTVVMRQEYPGVVPVSGWRVEFSRGGRVLSVVSASGRELICFESYRG